MAGGAWRRRAAYLVDAVLPRLSLEERDGTHARYVAAVTAAANDAFDRVDLRAADRDA